MALVAEYPSGIGKGIGLTADQYLQGILQREAVATGLLAPALAMQARFEPAIRQWAGEFLSGVSPSGSFAKGTANHSGTDIDLFIALSSETPATLKSIHDTLFQKMTEIGYTPKRQNVSINVKAGGFSVDLVPAKRQSPYGDDFSLYRRKADTWMKTNVAKHITHVRQAGRLNESRILKLWRDQKGLEFPSFYLELTVIDGLAGTYGTLSDKVLKAFEYIGNSFAIARVVDPANTNNIISDDLTAAERVRVASAAQQARRAQNWSQIVL